MKIVTNAQPIQCHLSTAHEVTVVDDAEVLGLFNPAVFDLVIVDVDASQGIFCPRVIRKADCHLPIIGISEDLPYGGEWPEQRAIFIEQGGNYLLQAPINTRELLACALAISRFTGTQEETVLCGGKLIISRRKWSVDFDGNQVTDQFTLVELKVLLALVRNMPVPMSNADITDCVYDRDADAPDSNTLQVFIGRLRTKLDDLLPGLGRCIVTMRNYGYKLEDVQCQ